MNRIVITLNKHGEFDYVSTDQDCRVFIHDINCTSEPIYELTHGKKVGVHYVTSEIGDNLAATFDSDGAWKPTKAEIKIVE